MGEKKYLEEIYQLEEEGNRFFVGIFYAMLLVMPFWLSIYIFLIR